MVISNNYYNYLINRWLLVIKIELNAVIAFLKAPAPAVTILVFLKAYAHMVKVNLIQIHHHIDPFLTSSEQKIQNVHCDKHKTITKTKTKV